MGTKRDPSLTYHRQAAKPGEAVVVTVAIDKEVQKLKTWAAMLGIQIEEMA